MPQGEPIPNEERLSEEQEVTDPAGLLNIHEAATFLHVSESSVRRWSNSGKLKCYRVGEARLRRYTKRDIQAFLEQNGH